MRLEDTLAIHEMIAQDSYAYDSQDADGFAQVFVENGVFEIFVPGKPMPVARLQWRQAIRAWAAQRRHARLGRFTSRHDHADMLFDALTAEEARVRVMVLVTRREATETPPSVHLTGVYHDVWRKTPEGWQLAHRAAYADRDPGLVQEGGGRNLGCFTRQAADTLAHGGRWPAVARIVP